MEKDDELKGSGNSYDFGNRMYDPRIGRFLSMDTYVNKYSYQSPYVFSANNPVSFVDIKGDSAYLVIWFSKDGETGHAGLAVDNYMKVEKKVIENGKKVTKIEWVPDGTVTYYDLWPEKPVGKTELQDNVPDDYNRKYHMKKEDLFNSDPSKSGEAGKVSENGEGRVPDGIVAIGTSGVREDYKIKLKMKSSLESGKDYNACSNNCSSFAQKGLQAIDPTFDASQVVHVTGALSVWYDDAKVIAPNNLYNAAAKMEGAVVKKGPAQTEAKPYLEYFGK